MSTAGQVDAKCCVQNSYIAAVCFRWGCKIFGERPESSPDEAEAADPSRVIATRSFRSRGRAGRYLRGGYADEDRGRESRL